MHIRTATIRVACGSGVKAAPQNPVSVLKRARPNLCAWVLGAVLLVPGCGGGGSSSTGSSPPPPPPVAMDGEAVAYQMTPAHTGVVTYSTPIAFPDHPAWSVTLGQYTSYPLIVNGRVYVVSSIATPTNPNQYGVYLYAFDANTGGILWGPVTIDGPYMQSNLAYDRGRLFVTNFNASVWAFDAVTGTQLWSVVLDGGGGQGTSAPTAVNGLVYVTDGGAAHAMALDGSTGAVRWSQPVKYGGGSSPAVTAAGAYVAYPCHYYSFEPTSGTAQWLHTLNCESGGGITPVASGSRVFLRDSATGPNGQVLDAATGAFLRAYPIDSSPAVTTTTMYLVADGVLSAADSTTGTTLWSYADPGGFVTSPIVVNGYVIVATASGSVEAINATSGALAWTGDAGSTIPAADPPLAIPLTALASADHLLAVPTDTGLTVWSLAAP